MHFLSPTAAVPRYDAGVTNATNVRKYAEIECPYQIGRLASQYTFSWQYLVNDFGVSLTNGTRGVYWLAEENNRILHVDLSAAIDTHFRCVVNARSCSGFTNGPIECRFVFERFGPTLSTV